MDQMRSGGSSRAVFLIGALLVFGSARALASRLEAGPATSFFAEEIVFVSEDTAIPPISGCDGVSRVAVPSGGVVTPGEHFVSPGRLAGTSSLSYILSPFANSRRALYVLHRPVLDEETWHFMGIAQGVPIAYSSGIAVLPDDDTFIVAKGSSGRYDPLHVHAVPPFSVAAFRLSDIVWDGLSGRLGPPVFEMETDGLAGEILVSADGSQVHIVLDHPARVTTVDVDTWGRSAPDIELQPLSRTPGYISSGTAPNFVHATLNTDGRHIISNRLDSNEINIANVISRESWTLGLPSALGGPMGAVDVSHGLSNHGRIAIHGTRHIGVYDFDPRGGLVEISRAEVSIPASSVPHEGGPTGRLAWSRSGEYLIAADVSGQAEFSVFHVDSVGGEIERTARVTVCTSPRSGWPIDILTGNRIFRPPTATATSTALPSRTPGATHPATETRAVPTPLPSRTASAEPTSIPPSAYLPISLRERCIPETQRQDTVLAIDTSSSMGGVAPSGRTKLEEAQFSAQRFLSLLDLGERDRAAIVSFDSAARVDQPLTEDRDRLLRALDSLRVAEQTCLPCAVDLAIQVLESRHDREGSAPVLILLTDGRSNPRPAGEAVTLARRAHAKGVVIFAIGLGDDLDTDALKEIASRPTHFYHAASAEDLVAIYERIAIDVPCPTNLPYETSTPSVVGTPTVVVPYERTPFLE